MQYWHTHHHRQGLCVQTIDQVKQEGHQAVQMEYLSLDQLCAGWCTSDERYEANLKKFCQIAFIVHNKDVL